jgi:hypothetical protein
MQIVEELVKRTLDGEVTSYMVRGGTDPKAQLLITEVDGEIFDSSDRAKAVLIERVTAIIARQVDAAVQKAKEWYPNSFEAPSDDPLTLLKKSPGTPPDVATKGRKAKPAPANPVAELAAELQQESDEIALQDATLITLPDGSKAKVNSIKLPDVLT